jgi:ethanolamine ammonia-lyase small subunit
VKEKETSEQLLDEIKSNANKDRDRLEQYCDKLVNYVINSGDPELMVGASDGISKVAAELTRNNQQLVEVAKLRLKKDLVTIATDGIADADREAISDFLGESLGGDN